MTRVGLVTVLLAREFDRLDSGDRIPNVQELAKRFDCGKGTVQQALVGLEESGAVRLKAHGSLGTFLEEVDRGLLWRISDRRSVSIAMPLPYSRRYEGLATGLQAAFATANVPLSLSFMRGSVARTTALKEGRVDLVLLSQLAADHDPELRIVQSYGPSTYVGAHCLVLAAGRDPHDPKLRVGVDASSTDQVALVATAFGSPATVELVPVSYNQLNYAFQSGAIDATVWNRDEIRTHITVPIDLHDLPEGPHETSTVAVIAQLASDEDQPVAVLEALRDPDVLDRASAVLAGDIFPTY